MESEPEEIRSKIKKIACDLFNFLLSRDFKKLDEKMASEVAKSYKVIKKLSEKSKYYFRDEELDG
jgi:hypothetical protein